jgi:hypothetical protein
VPAGQPLGFGAPSANMQGSGGFGGGGGGFNNQPSFNPPGGNNFQDGGNSMAGSGGHWNTPSGKNLPPYVPRTGQRDAAPTRLPPTGHNSHGAGTGGDGGHWNTPSGKNLPPYVARTGQRDAAPTRLPPTQAKHASASGTGAINKRGQPSSIGNVGAAPATNFSSTGGKRNVQSGELRHNVPGGQTVGGVKIRGEEDGSAKFPPTQLPGSNTKRSRTTGRGSKS